MLNFFANITEGIYIVFSVFGVGFLVVILSALGTAIYEKFVVIPKEIGEFGRLVIGFFTSSSILFILWLIGQRL